MSPAVNRLKLVQAQFPTLADFQREVERELEVAPGEQAKFVGMPTMVSLPDVVLLDFDQIAERLGWSLGQLIGYFAFRGVITVVQEAEAGGPH